MGSANRVGAAGFVLVHHIDTLGSGAPNLFGFIALHHQQVGDSVNSGAPNRWIEPVETLFGFTENIRRGLNETC